MSNIDGPIWTDPEAWLFSHLKALDMELFQAGLERMHELCRLAREKGVVILLDAEQTQRQPAIEMMAHILWRRFDSFEMHEKDNVPTTMSGGAVLYNTYQMYLSRSPSAVVRDMRLAREGGYRFAAKIVRGAYLSSERSRARAMGLPDPIVASKETCDISYDSTVYSILAEQARLRNDGLGDQHAVSVFVATHNAASVDRAIKAMRVLGLPPALASVHFAQILGMADHLTCALGLSGHNACKLVPYGDFDDVLPWLLRRLEENQDVLGAGQSSRPLIAAEIRRRMGAWLVN